MNTFPVFEQNDDTLKRLDAVGADLIRSKKHITQGGGRYPRNGHTNMSFNNECRDEAARILRSNGFSVSFRNGSYEVTK